MWQVLYDECKDENFVIVAVALDAGGRAAAENSIRPTDAELAERPDVVARLMGWGEEEWRHKAAPQYPCLIDEDHLVADLYGMSNVPTAVWIDENGRIVRPSETPGHSDYGRRRDPVTRAVPQEDAEIMVANRRTYWNALRDWVAKGDQSEFVLSADEVRERIRRPSEADVQAALHARIGRHVFAEGDWGAAKRHYEEAVRLCPEKWHYFRQSMVLEPDLVGELNTASEFFTAQEALGEDLYFPAIDMPGIAGPPPWLKKDGG